MPIIDPVLQAEMNRCGERERIKVNILLSEQTKPMELLRELEQNGLVEDIQSFWLVNCVSCKANRSVIVGLAQRYDIKTIYFLEEARWILFTRQDLELSLLRMFRAKFLTMEKLSRATLYHLRCRSLFLFITCR